MRHRPNRVGIGIARSDRSGRLQSENLEHSERCQVRLVVETDH